MSHQTPKTPREKLLGMEPNGEPVQVFLKEKGSPRLPRISRGEGIYFWDTEGKKYLDVSSGPVANNLGSCNSKVLSAMKAQASKASFAFPGQFESEANERLANLLTSLAGEGFERAFFVSGGSEAVESAIKLARQYALAQNQSSRWKVISRNPSYHGGTLGALTLTGDKHMHDVFGPLLSDMPKVRAPVTYRVPENHTVESFTRACVVELEDRINAEEPGTVLAFIIEPIGGLSSGAVVSDDFYMKEVRRICSKYGVLLIHDEVMSGAGRTGKFLASNHYEDAQPDIVVLAKGIAAGYTPMGAILTSDHIVNAVTSAGGFLNGFTYFTNPLSCAIGHAVLQEMLECDLITNAAERGEELKEVLEALKAQWGYIGDVRGKGLLLALELVADQETKTPFKRELNAVGLFQNLAMQNGLLIYGRRTNYGEFGDWLMITPPLIITTEQISELGHGLAKTLKDFERCIQVGLV